MSSHAPKEARAALDQAISDYCAACDEPDDGGAFIPTGWVLAVAGVRSSFDGDGETTYITECMPGQSWHAGLGLWMFGQDNYRRDSE